MKRLANIFWLGTKELRSLQRDTVLVIFVIQNAHAVQVSFLGVQVRLSLAVALLLAAVAGALLMAAAGTARITQLRRVIRRDRRRVQPQAPDAPRP